MEKLNLDAIIEDFWREYRAGVYFPPQWFDRLTLDDGYRIQFGLKTKRLAQGARQIGWKVGLTSEAMQQQFRVREPLFGYLLEEGRYPSGASFEFDRLIQPAVETEICVELETDLVGPRVDESAAREAIASVRPAIELAETRGPFTEQLALAISENIQQKAIVLGDAISPLPPDLDLASVQVAVSINGQGVASATGAAVLGDPLRSVAWLANKLAELGLSLKAGELVMTGSLTHQFLVSRGDHVISTLQPLGVVEVSFV